MRAGESTKARRKIPRAPLMSRPTTTSPLLISLCCAVIRRPDVMSGQSMHYDTYCRQVFLYNFAQKIFRRTALRHHARVCIIMPMNMLNQTLTLLRSTDIPMLQIAKDCGLKVRWLYKLREGEYTDPGVQKIERLYHYLMQREAA